MPKGYGCVATGLLPALPVKYLLPEDKVTVPDS